MDEAKYRYWTKEYSDHLIEDVSDEMVLEYEEGVAGEVVNEFVVEEDYVMQLIEYWIDNFTIGNNKCKEIVDNLDYDIFEIDMEFGTRPESWKQAGVWALDHAIHNNDNIESIYKLTNEKLQKLWKK